jgi:GDP-4-dehydro-6-deoxy-D-mannose reductase
LQKVLITGITGFTGSHLAEYLATLGVEVYGLALPLHEPYRQDCLKKVSKIYYIDIKEQAAVSKIIHIVEPDYIFHLAGLIISKDLKELLESNVLGTKNVLEAILDSEVRILIPGSAAEYGIVQEDELPITEATSLHPINNYGISKVGQTLLGYQFYFNYGCRVYIARPFNITGPGEPPNLVCSTIAMQVVNIQKKHLKPIIYVGNKETKRDFIDVRDVVKAYWAIINNGIPGQVYNVCSEEAHSIEEIVNIISMISNIKLDIQQDSARVRVVDIPIQIGKNEKIKKHTGWHPEIKFEKTQEDIVEYYMQK